VLHVQDGLHREWDLTDDAYTNARRELPPTDPVDISRLRLTTDAIRRMRQRYLEGFPGRGAPRSVRSPVPSPSSFAPRHRPRSETTGLSYELQGAPPGPTARDRVRGWLIEWLPVIVAAEARHGIDRRAIATAIAWEALHNVQSGTWGGLARWTGAGKVHVREHRTTEGDPASRQAEHAGYLRVQSGTERGRINENPAGAITYISAIMQAFAEIADEAGYNIRCEVDILATFYNGWNLSRVRTHFSSTRAPTPLRPAPDRMAAWAANPSNVAWIEGIVGTCASVLRQRPRGWI
jgi:hypothetical protein